MDSKICKICGVKKELTSNFYLNKNGTYRNMCISCKKKRDAARKPLRDAQRKKAKDAFYALSHKEVCSIVQYNPENGIIYMNNKSVNTSLSNGYEYVQINGCSLKVHRLAFFIMMGYWPKCVDHIDGNRSNNVWSNLRESDVRKNGLNYKRHRNGRIVGASYHKQLHKWVARATNNNGRMIALGVYNTEKEAGIAYAKYMIKENIVPRHMFSFTDKELGICNKNV